MTSNDLDLVFDIAEQVHQDFPEALEVLAEKQRLSPQSCFMLEQETIACGYLLAHPWRAFDVPPLDAFLGSIPDNADLLYLHDIALMPQTRGKGMAGAGVALFEKSAIDMGYEKLALCAVNGSVPFWQHIGFVTHINAGLEPQLAKYSPDAAYMVKTL